MTTMKVWLALLLSIMRPAVEGAEKTDTTTETTETDATEETQTELDLEATTETETTEAEDPGAVALEAERKRAKEAEERAAKAEREAADLRVRAAPKPTNEIEESENKKLADPNTTALERWQIESNRTLRANTSAATMALAQAADVRDQTAFATVCLNDPLAKKYEARVEEALAKARQVGQNPSREAVYTYLLGQDMRGGKFKKKAAAAPKPEASAPRGKLPGVRSDVAAKGAQTEHEKRRARLENQQI